MLQDGVMKDIRKVWNKLNKFRDELLN